MANPEKARILLVGPANVGKSSLFTALTKRFATVSNYPGTTVEVARTEFAGAECLDTPGFSGLIPASEEEAVTHRVLLEGANETVVAVLDARDLGRSLALLLALSEFDHRFVVALNLSDEAEDAGISIDAAGLEEALGVPVVPTVAVTRQGIPRLRARLAEAKPLSIRPADPADVGEILRETVKILPPGPHPTPRARLALAGHGLEGIPREPLAGLSRRLAAAYGVSAASLFARGRSLAASQLAARLVMRGDRNATLLGKRLGDIALHPIWGWPVLAGILFLLYEVVGVFAAGTLVDLIEEDLFGGFLLPIASRLLGLLPDGAVETFLLAPEGHPGTGLLIGRYGLLSVGLTYAVAIVLPVVSFFFLAFALMEDTGYLPRLAVMLDRIFRAMGLNGRAVLPLVLGLGCDTMATMTTRILPSQKERLLVIFLLALAVPCSAQMGVLAALAAALSLRAVAVWCGVLLAVLFAAGWIGARVIPGRPAPFLLEIPPMRLPRAGNVLAKTAARSEWYLREAVPLFLAGTFLLWVLDAARLLGVIENGMAPVVVGLLGLPREAAGSFLMGFLRRDYGAAGLYALFAPALDAGQAAPGVEGDIVVSMVTITLFIPCVANFLIIGKEKGWRAACAVGGLTVAIALAAGTGTRLLMEGLGWS